MLFWQSVLQLLKVREWNEEEKMEQTRQFRKKWDTRVQNVKSLGKYCTLNAIIYALIKRRFFCGPFTNFMALLKQQVLDEHLSDHLFNYIPVSSLPTVSPQSSAPSSVLQNVLSYLLVVYFLLDQKFLEHMVVFIFYLVCFFVCLLRIPDSQTFC